jgi:arginyl-tRNA synthetase
MAILERVRKALHEALARVALAGGLGDANPNEITEWTIERPKRAEHGDFATNIAMVATKRAKKPPRAIAEALVAALADNDVIRSAEVAGPGFVNLRLHASLFHDELQEILIAGKAYGRAPAATAERINIEFVSANPTGPINVASGRNAIYGDTVGRLLEATGNRVTREYYINDFGNQIRLFASSVRHAAKGEAIPEDGYHGEYVTELGTFFKANYANLIDGNEDDFSRLCVTFMLRGIEGSKALPGIRKSLASIGVFFDVWFSEESLHRWGAVPAALKTLENKGYLKSSDGAVFFVMPSKDGKEQDDKDRVVKKSDGNYTYFASDIAYHADKLARGYDRLITVLGVDHHGYVARMRNALEALGLPSERYEALLYNLVYILRDGQVQKSSKRAGNFVTLEEIADEIDEAAHRKGAGSDALRFFFLSRGANTNVDFDIDLAKKESLDNPVFYVQYGFARLSSILRKAETQGFTIPKSLSREQWSKLAHDDELAIALRLSELPGVIRAAADAREPHRVVFYLQELAREFQSYFTRLKVDPILPQDSVRSAENWEKNWDHGKTNARLAWIVAIRNVYAAGLGLLGVGAPEEMRRPSDADAAET